MSDRTGCPDPKLGDLLAAYEQDLLPESQRRAFEAHVLDCEECLEELYEMAPFVGEMLDDPARYRRAAETAARAASPSFAGRLAGWLRGSLAVRIAVPVAVAVALALVLVVNPGDDARKLSGLALVEHVPYVQIDTRAWGAEEAGLLFERGMRNYIDRDYGAAANLLGESVAMAAGDDSWDDRHLAHFYLGMSRLLAGEAGLAVAPLTEAADSPLAPVADRARWQLAQAHLLLDDGPAARAALEGLTASPAYGERARELIARMDTLESGD